MLFRFAAIVYLARVLLVDGFGRLNFAVALVTYFMLLVNAGLNELGVREVARRPEEVDHYVGTITALRATLSLVAFCLLAVTSRLIGLSGADTVLVLIVGGMLFTYGFSVEWAFRGLERMGAVGRSRSINSLFYLIAVVTVIRGVGDILIVGACLVGGELIAVSYLYMQYWKQVGPIRLSFNLDKWKGLLYQSWSLGLAFAMTMTIFQVDFVLLGLMKGQKAVGLYSAAGRLITVFYTLSIIYVTAIFPQIAQRAKDTPEDLGRFLSQAARAVMVAALPAGLLATLLARPIIGALYGAPYLGAVLAFQVLVWSLVVYVPGHLLSYSLVGQDRQKAYLGVLTLAATVNVVLNLLCIGPFGILGAAGARLVTQIVILAVAYALLSRALGFTLTREIARTGVAGAVMGVGILLGLNWPLPVVVAVAVFLYVGTLVLVQGVTSADVRMLREIVFSRLRVE
jgi:O-antigen/teichoic acid export membrane protein